MNQNKIKHKNYQHSKHSRRILIRLNILRVKKEIFSKFYPNPSASIKNSFKHQENKKKIQKPQGAKLQKNSYSPGRHSW